MKVAGQNSGSHSLCTNLSENLGIIKYRRASLCLASCSLLILALISIFSYSKHSWSKGTGILHPSDKRNSHKPTVGFHWPNSNVPTEKVRHSTSTFLSQGGCPMCRTSEFDANQCRDPGKINCMSKCFSFDNVHYTV